MNSEIRQKGYSTAFMARVAILTAVSVILQYLNFPLAFLAPPFIKWDIADMPALLAGYSMGPVAGVLVMFFKNLLLLIIKGSSTGGVGELSNFIVGSTFVLTAVLIYRRYHTFKAAVISLIAGVLTMSAVACLSNYYVIFPLYAQLMIPMDKIIAMGAAVTSKVVDLKTMILYTVLPFNLVKGSSAALVTLLLYRRLRSVLKIDVYRERHGK